MSKISENSKLLQDITDFIQFEDETSLTWPWAVSADDLLRDDVVLQSIANAVQCDEDGNYDTDDLFDAINKIADIERSFRKRGENL